MNSTIFLQRILFGTILTLILTNCLGQARLVSNHQLIYHYSKPVGLSKQIVRLHPFDSDPRIRKSEILLNPSKSRIVKSIDSNLNNVWAIDPIDSTDRFIVTICLEIDTSKLALTENKYSFSAQPKEPKYLQVEKLDESTKKLFTEWSLKQNQDAENKALDFCKLVYETFDYQERYETGVLAPQELLKRGSGACRDLSWFLLQILRFNGIHSRLVSGYLISGSSKSYELGFHAWVEALTDNGKWIGLDPTSGEAISGYHIPLAIGADYSEIIALKGYLTGICDVDFDYLMDIKIK